MFDFEKKYQGCTVVIIDNLSRATLKEAKGFKKLIDDEIHNKTLKMVIDLSTCEFLDSTFIGVLVITLKKMGGSGGELRLVQPSDMAYRTLTTSELLISSTFIKVKQMQLPILLTSNFIKLFSMIS